MVQWLRVLATLFMRPELSSIPRQFIEVFNFSSRGSHDTFWPLQTTVHVCTQTYATRTPMLIKYFFKKVLTVEVRQLHLSLN